MGRTLDGATQGRHLLYKNYNYTSGAVNGSGMIGWLLRRVLTRNAPGCTNYILRVNRIAGDKNLYR